MQLRNCFVLIRQRGKTRRSNRHPMRRKEPGMSGLTRKKRNQPRLVERHLPNHNPGI